MLNRTRPRRPFGANSAVLVNDVLLLRRCHFFHARLIASLHIGDIHARVSFYDAGYQQCVIMQREDLSLRGRVTTSNKLSNYTSFGGIIPWNGETAALLAVTSRVFFSSICVTWRCVGMIHHIKDGTGLGWDKMEKCAIDIGPIMYIQRPITSTCTSERGRYHP